MQNILVLKAINHRTIISLSSTNIGVLLRKAQHMIDSNRINKELIQVIQIDLKVIRETVLLANLTQFSEAMINEMDHVKVPEKIHKINMEVKKQWV